MSIHTKKTVKLVHERPAKIQRPETEARLSPIVMVRYLCVSKQFHVWSDSRSVHIAVEMCAREGVQRNQGKGIR